MTNTVAFEVALVKAGKTKKATAAALGISEIALYRKINNITEFKASEIFTLKSFLRLSDFERDAIFFACNRD